MSSTNLRFFSHIRAFAHSQIFARLFTDHGILVADMVAFLENAPNRTPNQSTLRLEIVKMIVETASWLYACKAVGGGESCAMEPFSYSSGPADDGTESRHDELLLFRERAQRLCERVAYLDRRFRLEVCGGSGNGVLKQHTLLSRAADAGAFGGNWTKMAKTLP